MTRHRVAKTTGPAPPLFEHVGGVTAWVGIEWPAGIGVEVDETIRQGQSVADGYGVELGVSTFSRSSTA
jgi:hypothetical protein